MKRKIARVSLLALVLTLTACATPQSIRQGAELAGAGLGLLQTELRQYAASANDFAKRRTERLKRQATGHALLQQETEETLYIGLAGDKQPEKEYKQLVALADQYRERDAAKAAFTGEYAARMAALTKKLGFPTGSFETTMEALAKLAEEEEDKDQLKFLLKYIKDVKTEYEKLRKAEEEVDSTTDAQSESGGQNSG